MDPSFAQSLGWLVALAVVVFVFLALLQLFGIKRLLQQLVDLQLAQPPAPSSPTPADGVAFPTLTFGASGRDR